MRTKHVLMAMMLPAVFAACTSDDFMEQPATNTLANRKLLSADFSVNVLQQPETRFAWENYQWAFEDGDGFGAAVVDPVQIDQISSTQMLGNYLYSKNSNGKFTTNSQMVEGTYMFYSFDGYQTKSSRDLVSFNLGTQSADLSKPEAVINDKTKQLFFSPLYKIEAETSAEPLDLGFYPYWSAAAFRIVNSTGQDLKISQIVLNDATAPFVVKGKIDPSKLNDKALKYVYDEEEGGYALNATEFKKVNEVDLSEENYHKVMQTADIATADADGESNTIALNCNGYELADGKEVTAYMNVPMHVSSNLSVSIIVVDEEGQSKEINVVESGTDAEISSTGISKLTFSRDKTNPVFGFNTDGKTMKALTVKKENLVDAAGFYVDNKADLLNVINSNRGAIMIYNFGDLAIDDEIAKAITEYTGAGITFSNPIALKCTNASLEKTTFNANVTVESGNIEFKDVKLGGKIGNTAIYYDVDMTIKAGKVTLTDGTYNNTNSSIIVEGGELVLNKANIKVESITNKGGVVTVAKENSIDNINLTFVDTNDAAGNAVATTLNVNAKLTVANFATGANTTVNNASEITVNTTLTNNGVFNNGTETSDAAKVLGTGAFVNAKTVNNYGTIKTNTVTNNANATVNNYKWFGLDASGNSSTSSNAGKIVMKNATSRVYVSTGAGEIDNTALGYVTNKGNNNTVAVTVTESMKNEEVIKDLGTFTKLYLNGGTWTIDDVTNLTTLISSKTLVLNGGNINIKDVTLTVAALHVAKSAKVMGAITSSSILSSTAVITAAANATLTTEFATVKGGNAGGLNDKDGVYYIDGTNTTAITETGATGKTVTYKATAATTVSMAKNIYTGLQAKVVIGSNVTLNLTDTNSSDFSSDNVPATPEVANADTDLISYMNTTFALANTTNKVSLAGGAWKATFTITFSEGAKTVTAEWNATKKTWVVTNIAG